jgi:hypothetical protein
LAFSLFLILIYQKIVFHVSSGLSSGSLSNLWGKIN